MLGHYGDCLWQGPKNNHPCNLSAFAQVHAVGLFPSDWGVISPKAPRSPQPLLGASHRVRQVRAVGALLG